jgi:hypothetical protein
MYGEGDKIGTDIEKGGVAGTDIRRGDETGSDIGRVGRDHYGCKEKGTKSVRI